MRLVVGLDESGLVFLGQLLAVKFVFEAGRCDHRKQIC